MSKKTIFIFIVLCCIIIVILMIMFIPSKQELVPKPIKVSWEYILGEKGEDLIDERTILLWNDSRGLHAIIRIYNRTSSNITYLFVTLDDNGNVLNTTSIHICALLTTGTILENRTLVLVGNFYGAFFALCVTSNGKILWNWTLPLPNASFIPYGIVYDAIDNSFISVGVLERPSIFRPNIYDMFVLKFQRNNCIWLKILDFGYEEALYSVVVTPSNFIYCCGKTDFAKIEKVTKETDAIILKLAQNGEQIWINKIATDGYDSFYDCIIKDDRIYVTGSINGDVAIFEYTFTGNILKNTTIGWSQIDEGRLLLISSNEIFVVGVTSSYGNGYFDILLIKLDKTLGINSVEIWGTQKYDIPLTLIHWKQLIIIGGYCEYIWREISGCFCPWEPDAFIISTPVF